MNFFEIINTRKTVRNYESYIPPVEDIERIIDSARLAPSACNAQNWEFIAIYNQEIKDKMADEVLKVYDFLDRNLKDEEIKKQAMRFKGHSTFFTKAPVLIVCIETKCEKFLDGVLESAGIEDEEMDLMRPDSQLLSMGAAIENISLTAHALGLGTCWMVAPVIAQKGFKKILDIKDEDKIVSLIALGKPVKTFGRAPKKELKEIMRTI